MMNKQEILPAELSNYVGKKLTFVKGDKQEDMVLVRVKESSFSARITRDDQWDGIEPWFDFPDAANPNYRIYLAD